MCIRELEDELLEEEELELLEEELELLLGLGSFSYTQLGVYKRQAVRTVGSHTWVLVSMASECIRSSSAIWKEPRYK